MAMRLGVSYISYTTYSRGKTGDIITFTPFEEGGLLSETHNLLSETCDDTESGNESGDNSTLPPLISEEEMDVMSSGNGSDTKLMSTEMLADIRACIQYHQIINRREACYKIRYHINLGQV